MFQTYNFITFETLTYVFQAAASRFLRKGEDLEVPVVYSLKINICFVHFICVDDTDDTDIFDKSFWNKDKET